MATTSFTDLKLWQEAHKFVLLAYKITESFPKGEMFGLTSQFRRAAVSIAANIAEGYPKKGVNDKLRFYNISQGSLEECRYYIILSFDLKYIDEKQRTQLWEQIENASHLLNNYCKTIRSSNS
ncbi:MAG: four helix bundle protein [Prevotellaceae bacterium]|jgi:four helix bundle protein|nr:four helix bundle protein [Prevotellaceae bacterium]